MIIKGKIDLTIKYNIQFEKSASDEENPALLSNKLNSNSTVDETAFGDVNIDTSIKCITCLEHCLKN